MSNNDYLAHYGILGMKWGVRRYQNSDGSYTAAGKKHYGSDKASKTTKGVFTKGEIRRVTDAAKLERKAIQLSKKNNPKKQDIKNVLEKARNTLVSDLDSDQIQYGRNRAARQRTAKYNAIAVPLSVVSIAGAAAGFSPFGFGSVASSPKGAAKANRRYVREHR